MCSTVQDVIGSVIRACLELSAELLQKHQQRQKQYFFQLKNEYLGYLITNYEIVCRFLIILAKTLHLLNFFFLKNKTFGWAC